MPPGTDGPHPPQVSPLTLKHGDKSTLDAPITTPKSSGHRNFPDELVASEFSMVTK